LFLFLPFVPAYLYVGITSPADAVAGRRYAGTRSGWRSRAEERYRIQDTRHKIVSAAFLGLEGTLQTVTGSQEGIVTRTRARYHTHTYTNSHDNQMDSDYSWSLKNQINDGFYFDKMCRCLGHHPFDRGETPRPN
jgi:hypothetical protein